MREMDELLGPKDEKAAETEYGVPLARLAFHLAKKHGIKSSGLGLAHATLRAAFIRDGVQEMLMAFGLRAIMDRHPELDTQGG